MNDRISPLRLINTILTERQKQGYQHDNKRNRWTAAKIVGEMRETVREKLESMEAGGVTCIPIEDVRIMLSEHYNFMYQLIYEGR